MSNAPRHATFALLAPFVLLAAIASATAAAAPPDPQQLAFWIGTWDLGDGTRAIGTSRVEWIAGGRAVRESYEQPGFSGQSLTAIDGTDGLWHQTWVDSLGRISRFSGAWRDGALRLEGASHGADGTIVRRRLMLAPRDDGTVRQWSERFDDARGDWVPLYDYVLRPHVETPPAPRKDAPETPSRAEPACADAGAARFLADLRDGGLGSADVMTRRQRRVVVRALAAAVHRPPRPSTWTRGPIGPVDCAHHPGARPWPVPNRRSPPSSRTSRSAPARPSPS